MEPANFTAGWIDVIHGHLTLAITVGVGIVIFTYLKPKLAFKLAAAVAVLGMIAYVIAFLFALASTGIDETAKFKDRPHIKINE